jgi:hypothetical protein
VNRRQLLGEGGQHLAALLRDDDDILDANPRHPAEVDPGFDGDDVAGSEHVVGFRPQGGRLVDEEADAVTEAVPEVLAVACVADRHPGGNVHIPPRATRTHRIETGLLRSAHELVDVAQRLRDLPDGERPGAVGAVAVELGAGVDEHEVAVLDDAVAGFAVRAGGRRARRDVDRESDVVGATFVEKLRHPPDELSLGATRESLLDEQLVRPIRHLRRAPDRVELRRLLDDAQRLDDAALRHELDAAAAKELVVGVGQRVCLEGDAAREALGEIGVDVPPRLLELDALDRARPLGVPEVGEEPRALRLDEQRRVRAFEAGQIENIDGSGDEERLLDLCETR